MPRRSSPRRVGAAVAAATALAVPATASAAPAPAGLFDGRAELVETTHELSPPAFNHPHSETAITLWEPTGEYVMLHRSFRVDTSDGDRQYLDISRATSADGLTWTAFDGGDPVLLAEEGDEDFEARSNCPPSALCAGALVGDILYEEVGGTPRLTLVYEQGAYGRSAGNYVVSAYSEDAGVTWQEHRAIVTPTESWEGAGFPGAKGVGTPSIVKSGATYWVSYHGLTSLTGTGTISRGFASGPDLDSLSKQATPALRPGPSGSWTEVGIGKADLIERNGWYYLAYEGFSGAGVECTPETATGWHIARARTPTGEWEDMPGTLPFVADPNGRCGNDMPNIHELVVDPVADPDPSVVATGDIDAGERLRRFSLDALPQEPPEPPAPEPVPASPDPPPQPPPNPASAPSPPAFIGLRLDPPTSAVPLCGPAPTRRTSRKGTVRLNEAALRIQQRIDAAALRRLNAVNAWIDAGIVPSDLCASAFGQGAFAGGIGWSGGAGAPSTTPPDPRPIEITRRRKVPADFAVDRRQLVINDRISRALLARARATSMRLAALTGGNLAPGSDLRGRPLYPGLAPVGPVPAIPDATPTRLSIGQVPPVGALRVDAATVRRTQKRSQRAIVLANEVIDRISSGLTEEQFVPGSIGSSHLSSG